MNMWNELRCSCIYVVFLHFIFIKISSWLHLLLEWFWSLVKLYAFRYPQIWKIVKIRKRSENFYFQRGVLPYEGVVRKYSFSRGIALLGGLISKEVDTTAYYDAGRGNQVMWGVCSGGVGSILLYIGGVSSGGGGSPLHGRINKIGLHRGSTPPCSLHWETL